ncbi:potassium transporter TrkA [Streptomyces sp. YC504]|uniref:Potassium transporter TrkA n=1 Tax=Streptomyces mesophilus TaxID=1775132 RepID=A0A6G4XI64_9ACTN|nr:potassium transporter TrkA [Streptomyces mesophilus]NGO76331.1 potassium transporter TrkA [Streptomyces mesophilus]
MGKLKYRFDNVMARGTPALIAVLAVICCLLAVFNGMLLLLLAPDATRPADVGSSVWSGFLRVISPALLLKDEGTAPFLLAAVAMTFGGIMLMSTLIPVISAGLQNQLARLRKGRSHVAETGHTVILGWSPQVQVILSELVEANRSERRACVAILAECDRTEMETQIHERVGSTATTRVVCRTGNPAEAADIAIVNAAQARAVIILPPDSGAPDLSVIKSLLAVSGLRGTGPLPNVVTSIEQTRNLAAARLAGGAHSRIVNVQGFIARLLVQTSLQSGLSAVCTELLDFAGCEIYMRRQPELAGRTYAEALLAYRTSSVIGWMKQDGTLRLNPPPDAVLEDTDTVVVISEDDSTVKLADAAPELVPVPEPVVRDAVEAARRVLILGWSARVPDIVRELEVCLSADSSVDVVADAPAAGPVPSDSPLQLTYRSADITDRTTLEGLRLDEYDQVMVVCPDDRDPDGADARTLTTLLNLRDLADLHAHTYTLVTEMADDRDRALAQATRADDFIVSSNLLSLRLAQMSENPHLDRVFEELFSAGGCRISLQPVHEYVPPGRAVTFYTVVDAARRRGHTAIGHRIHRFAAQAPAYGVEVNPDKATRITYADEDRVIVLSGRSPQPAV